MKTVLLPFLAVTAFAGVMTLSLSLGAATMLILTGGMGAIILQDYACRPRLRFPRAAVVPVSFPATKTRAEDHRLAA